MMKRETPGVSSETIKCSPQGPTWASDKMGQLSYDLECAVQFDSSIMLTGESGVGKKFVASLIHQRSPRGLAPFTILKCPDIVESPVKVRRGSEPNDLFKRALLKAANNGTILIDEIEKIPKPMQLELLRFIEIEPPSRDRVRLMTTCSTDLFERVRSNEFPEDLFYRLNVTHLVIPALRDRPEDIPILLRHYLSLYTRAEPPRLTTAALERLVAYPWPGNVGELKTVAEKLAVRNLPRPFEVEDLPPELAEKEG